MITKDMVIEEIKKLPDENLEIVFRVIRALESPSEKTSPMILDQTTQNDNKTEWQTFIQETYGCLAEATITRGVQGDFESRETIE